MVIKERGEEEEEEEKEKNGSREKPSLWLVIMFSVASWHSYMTLPCSGDSSYVLI